MLIFIHLLVWSICPLTAVVYTLGNSLSAILDGEARLTFLNRGEDYVMNMPYAHCKGQSAACSGACNVAVNSGHCKFDLPFKCFQHVHVEGSKLMQ